MPASRRTTDGPITDELARERATNAAERAAEAQGDADTAKNLVHDLDKRVHSVEVAVNDARKAVDLAHTSVNQAHDAVKTVNTKVDGLHVTLEEIKKRMNGPSLFGALIGLLAKPKDLVAVMAGISTIMGAIGAAGWGAHSYAAIPPRPQLVPVIISVPHTATTLQTVPPDPAPLTVPAVIAP